MAGEADAWLESVKAAFGEFMDKLDQRLKVATPGATSRLAPVAPDVPGAPDEHDAWFGNIKRTYDTYQQEDLANGRQRDMLTFTKAMDAAVASHTHTMNSIQAINMANIRAMDAHDLALDAFWNPVQQGAADTILTRAAAGDQPAIDAIAATLAAKLAALLNPAK